jgi:DNA repair exonuclease SbcCD ATPase subunit
MLDLHRIILTNFRSYRGTHKFEFPTEPGVYYLNGENKTDAIGENGAGKTTFIDAIVWCLYGVTTRGLKSNEVISWGASSCEVTLELTVGDKRLTVKRGQKPNSLRLNDRSLDQEELNTHLRLNYTSFIYSILRPQFGEPFFGLRPGTKLSLFSDIMELNYWLNASDEAAKQAARHQSKLEELNDLIVRGEGQLSLLTDDIKTLKQDAATYEDEVGHKYVDLVKEVKKLVKRIDEIDTKPESRKRADLLDQHSLEKRKLESWCDLRDSLLKKIESKNREKSANTFQKDEFEKKMGEIKLGDCPLCMQKIHNHQVDYVEEFYLKEIGKLTNENSKLSSLINKHVRDLLSAKNSIEAVGSEVNQIEKELKSIDQKIEADNNRKAILNSKIDSLEAQMVGLKSNANPYMGMLASKKQKLENLKDLVKRNTEKKTELEATHTATSWWVKGFKRIRLFIIERAFETLEVEVNNSLAQLGMPDWQITFDIERENKSGGITKGFVVFIKSPKNKEPVRWENWSGGETQRLSLAGDIGLANLIMEQQGLKSTIEFYDEPSTHMSPIGVVDFIKLLHERAISEGKRIWVIDHTSITNFGDFAGIITARKNENGSTISLKRAQG